MEGSLRGHTEEVVAEGFEPGSVWLLASCHHSGGTLWHPSNRPTIRPSMATGRAA